MFYESEHAFREDYYTFLNGINLNSAIHLHFCYELLVVTEGELWAKVGDQEYLMHKNDVLLVFPHQLHEFKTVEHSAHCLCIFSGDMVDYFHKKRQGTVPATAVLSLPREYEAPFWHIKSTDNLCYIKAILYNICGMFDEKADFVSVSTHPSQNLLAQMLAYIERHYMEPCTLQKLAEQLSYDPAYLSRYFTRQVRMSVKECINRRRVEEARFLIRSSEKSMLEIAELCGFGTLRSFNRIFLSLCDMTPSQFRATVS